MNLDIFSGLPRYVRLTVYTQIRRLLTTGLFNYEDQEDIAQDLLLFYLKKFYEVPDVDEALVVHALKQYASVMIQQDTDVGTTCTPLSKKENLMRSVLFLNRTIILMPSRMCCAFMLNATKKSAKLFN